MLKNKIVFIGPISPPITGPGVKNKEIIDSFNRHFVNIIEINSLDWTKRIFSFFVDVTINAIKNKRVILSISKKGRYVLLPYMYILNIIFGVKYMLLPAGGNLDKEFQDAFPLYKTFFYLALNKSSKIYVESKSLRNGLKNLNIMNIEYMPNPRMKLDYEWQYNKEKEKKVVFLSKIKEEKGVLILVEAAYKLHLQNKDLKFYFYGPIEKKFKEKFYKVINNTYIFYGGVVEPELVQKILSEADIFVLPTMWKNEGLPGVLVEASFTGVPMIISRFRASEEFIDNNINGIIVEPGNSEDIVEHIIHILNDREFSECLSENFKQLSLEFDVDLHVKRMLSDMKKMNWR